MDTQTGINMSIAKRILNKDLPASSKGRRGGGGGRLSLGIAFPEKNTCTIRFSQALIEKLGFPKSIQVASEGTNLIIGEKLYDDDDCYEFPEGENKQKLYNTPLVAWIVEEFGLDYSNGRTSRSFQYITPEMGENGKPYVIVDMSRGT